MLIYSGAILESVPCYVTTIFLSEVQAVLFLPLDNFPASFNNLVSNLFLFCHGIFADYWSNEQFILLWST
jgi:hypothetical protein